MIASASRRAKNLPMPVAVSAMSVAIAPLVCTPTIATPPTSLAGGGGLPRSQAQSRAATWRRISQGSISTASTRMRPMNTGTAPTGRV